MPAAALAIVVLAPALLGQTTLSPFRQLNLTDRTLQANGVAILVTGCDGCTPHLLGMWRTTDRFDVRAHIAMVLERLGPEGLPALIELTRDLNVVTDDGQRNLIIRALAPSGPAALDALIAQIEASPDTHSIAFLLPVAKELDIDPTPSARRLLASQNPEVRVKAIWTLSSRLPIVERSRTLLALARDPDERVRQAAAGYAVLPGWIDADRAAFPDEFNAYVAGLADLLTSTDDHVVRGAAATLRFCGRPASATPALRTIMTDPARSLWTRSDAMRAFISLSPDRAAAITEVVSLTTTFPIEASAALTDVQPHEIPDAVIPTLVAALKPARGREETWAADVLVRIGPRAVPPLIGALPSPDADLSAFAAEALGRIGPPATAAIDPLIAQLKSRGTGWQGEMYARALLAIDPDSKSAQDALAAVITRPSDDPMDTYVSGNALRELMREHGDQPWVRALAEPVLSDPKHPLHEFAMSSPNIAVEPLLAANEARIVKDFSDTRVRDAAWTYATGKSDIEPDPMERVTERNLRLRSVDSIRVLEHPSQSTIEALLSFFETPLLAEPEPKKWGEHAAGDRRANTLRLVWEDERVLGRQVAFALGLLVDAQPELWNRVFDSLRARPVWLGEVVATPIRLFDPSKQSVAIDVPPAIADQAAPLLVQEWSKLDHDDDRREKVLIAIYSLPSNDPDRTQMLLDQLLFGEGNAPFGAMAALGRTRPITPDILELIRTHLDDPRSAMRSAAIAAAGHAGASAVPLIEKLLAVGNPFIGASTGSDVARALQRIAPDDPRVIAFIAADREASLRPRTVFPY